VPSRVVPDRAVPSRVRARLGRATRLDIYTLQWRSSTIRCLLSGIVLTPWVRSSVLQALASAAIVTGDSGRLSPFTSASPVSQLQTRRPHPYLDEAMPELRAKETHLRVGEDEWGFVARNNATRRLVVVTPVAPI